MIGARGLLNDDDVEDEDTGLSLGFLNPWSSAAPKLNPFVRLKIGQVVDLETELTKVDDIGGNGSDDDADVGYGGGGRDCADTDSDAKPHDSWRCKDVRTFHVEYDPSMDVNLEFWNHDSPTFNLGFGTRKRRRFGHVRIPVSDIFDGRNPVTTEGWFQIMPVEDGDTQHQVCVFVRVCVHICAPVCSHVCAQFRL